ncbi:hypothetical protein COL154_014097, partial [Colletotrichum chrysophilum]
MEQERAGGLPGMQAFLAVLDSDSPEIKREMEKGRDEVRIMTVHATKGLEAPIVFLVDPGGDAFHASHMPAVRALPVDDTFGAAAPSAMLWVPAKTFENTITSAIKAGLKQSGEEEYRRLLYVGMTRAADRLVVCGYQSKDNPNYRHWQKMVWEALEGDGHTAEPRTFTAEGDEWNGLHFGLTPERVSDEEAASPPAPADPALPAAPDAPLALPRRLPRPLSPSGASAIIDGDEPERPAGSPIRSLAMPGSSALERGRIVHRFLQVLPDMPDRERRPAAERYLARAVPLWSAEDRDRIVEQVFAILDDPVFAPVFAAGSRAE